MSYSSRVFVIAAVLVLLALASYGSAFDLESFLRTPQQREAYRLATEYHVEEFDGACNITACDVPAGNNNCTYQTMDGNSTVFHMCTGFNFCNLTSNMCEAKFPEGHVCATADQCEMASYYIQPECKLNDTIGEKVCEQPIPLGWVGDSCEADEECFSNQCNMTAKVCEGFAASEACNATQECDRGLFCNAGACAAVFELNATCTSDEECGAVWNGVGCFGGHCIKPFSGAEGAACGASLGFMGICGADLYCDGSVCKKFEKIDCDLANETSCDSLPGTTCACNGIDGKSHCAPHSAVYTAGVIKYFDEGAKCAKDHSCAMNPTSKCFLENCGDDLDCFSFEMFKGVPSACLGIEFKCNKGGGSSSDHHASSDASRTTAAVVITALAAVAALL